MADAESRLKCFLHYGDESRVYSAVPPGQIQFFPQQVPSILEILSDDDKADGIINTITKVFHAEYSINPKICIFALAMVVRKAKLAKKKQENEKMEEVVDSVKVESNVEESMDVGEDSKKSDSSAGKSGVDTKNNEKKILSNEEKKKKYATKEDLRVCKAYAAARKLCSADNSGESFLLFSKFLRTIALSEKKKGFGCGWRKTVDNWYKSHDSKDLAEKVTKLTAFSWTHSDVLNMRRSIPDLSDDLKTVVSFVKLGIDAAKAANEQASIGDLAEKSKKAFEFLSAINTVRHTHQIEDVVNAIKTHDLNLEHIPPNFHKDCAIWSLLIPKMSIEQVLSLTVRMSKLKLFKDRDIARLYKARLAEYSDKDTTVDPIDVFVIRKNFMDGPSLALDFQLQQQRRRQQEEAAADNENASARERNPVSRQPPPRRSLDVEQSLISVYEKSLGNLAQTGLRYLIAVDPLAAVANRRCYPERFVTMEEAILLVALCVMKPETESNVKMIKFVQNETSSFKEVELNKDSETMETLKHKISGGGEDGKSANVYQLVQYLTTNKEVFDVIIVLSDNNMMPGSGAKGALERYRTEVNSKARLISCCFIGTYNRASQLSAENMFLICGFDAKVGRLIRAYSRGAF